MQWLKQHKLKLAISLVVACAFFWLLHEGSLRWLPDNEALAASKWWALPVYVAVWSLVHVVRAARWQLLLAPLAQVSLERLVAVSFVGFAAIVILPLRSGEMVRPALIRQAGTLSGWSATGTIGAERIIDGLILSLMLLIGLGLSTPLSPLPERIGSLDISPELVPVAAYFALGLFGVAFLAMGVFYTWRRQARWLVLVTLGRGSKPLAEWLSERVERVAAGFSFLPQARYTLPFIVITAAYWFLNAWGTCWLAAGVGMDLGLAEACVLTGVLALGIMVPNAPGFFGAFQFSAYAALSLFFVEAELLGRGSVLVFFLYLGQMIVTFGGALLGTWRLRTSLGHALTSDAVEAREPQG